MRILNVGCGSDTYGTDFADLYPSRKDVRHYDANTERLPYGSDTFDEVYAANVFEHLRNRDRFMTECHRVLKPEGKLVLITDNATFVFYVIDRHAYRSNNRHDRHYALFTEYHLRNWAEAYGFGKVRFEFHSPDFDMNVQNAGWIIRFIRSTAMLFFPKTLSAQHIKMTATKV